MPKTVWLPFLLVLTIPEKHSIFACVATSRPPPKAHLHRSQTSHTAQVHHLTTVPCTESEFGTLFSGLPFTFHKWHYTLDLGGTPALETLNRTLGAAWDTQEEPDHLTCFVATRVNEMEYFVRLSCRVQDLASIERTKDHSLNQPLPMMTKHTLFCLFTFTAWCSIVQPKKFTNEKRGLASFFILEFLWLDGGTML